MATVLPPGIDESRFNAALREFRAAVGADWVFSSEEDLGGYRDPYSHLWDTKEEHLASAAVAPATVEEVRQVVLIANKYLIPLYPISTGKNLAYGGASPVLSGSVVVDLKRMNKVIAVDDKRHFALVEPGCSYFDLYRHIKDNNLEVWLDAPDPGWGSLIGNALDHGVGTTHSMFRDHFNTRCGMEVVTPTGEIVRTGTGAVPGADTWQDHRYGQGPSVDGLFGQSNFGIVTKMGFWLMPAPEAHLRGNVLFPNFSDLDALINEMNYLENAGIIGRPNFDSPLNAPNPQLTALMAGGWPSPAEIEAYARARGGPAWRLQLQFYGADGAVQANWEYAKRRILKVVPGATFEPGRFTRFPLSPEQERTDRQVEFGIPNLSVFGMMARRPDGSPTWHGHVDFFAIIPRTAQGLQRGLKVLHDAQREFGEPATFTPFSNCRTWYPRAFHLGYNIPTFHDNPERNRRLHQLYAHLVVRCGEAGFGQYRTSVAMQDLSARQYSFNNFALRRFQEVLKDAADPNGIMAPGRYGLWPKRFRDRRGA